MVAKKPTRGVLIGSVLAIVAACVLLGIAYLQESSWAQGLLIELGIALLLFVPGALGADWLATRFKETRADVRQLESVVEASEEARAMRLEDVPAVIAKRLADERESKESVFKRVIDETRQETVLEALRVAQQLRITSAQGCRVPLHGTVYMMRFTFTDQVGSPSLVRLRIEQTNGTGVLDHVWNDGVAIDDLFLAIARELEDRGMYPGEPAYQPAQSLANLVDLLLIGSDARRRGFAHTLSDLIQVVQKEWAITDEALVSVSRPYYKIDLRRLDEMDWDRHMSAKVWVNPDNFREALETAQAMRLAGNL